MARSIRPLLALVALSTAAYALPTRNGDPPPPKPKPTATATATTAPTQKAPGPRIKASLQAFEDKSAIAVTKGGVLTTGQVFNGGSTQPPPPPTKGWPHQLLTASSTNCSRNPGPNEVIIYRDSAFTGSCSVLTLGFYPFPESLLVGNDAVSSIKVGSDVRARGFRNSIYGGGWAVYPPGSMNGGLGSWNDTISSFRIEPANRRETCDDIREGEIALYENPFEHGDCVVLPADTSYANPETMGIANDSISSIKNISSRAMTAFGDAGFSGDFGIDMPPHTLIHQLPEDGFLTKGINDNISSVQMQ